MVDTLKMYNVVLHGYVLMDNHIHLLVETLRPNLNEFMRRLNICYTGWFNYHHHTYGHLYQGRYKALLIDVDNYLLEVSRYVHLNPVRTGNLQSLGVKERWDHLKNYAWSSLAGFLESKYALKFINYDKIFSMIGSRNAYRHFILDGLRNGTDDLYENVSGQTILGDEKFVARIQDEYLKAVTNGEQPAYQCLVSMAIEPDKVLRFALMVLNLNCGINDAASRGKIERCMVAEFLSRFCDMNQKDIGLMLGNVRYSTVSMMRRRLRKMMAEDKAVKEKFEKAERELMRLIEN
jgi:hypothetical protein